MGKIEIRDRVLPKCLMPKTDEGSLVSVTLHVEGVSRNERRVLYRAVRGMEGNIIGEDCLLKSTSPTCRNGLNLRRGPGSAKINIGHSLEHLVVHDLVFEGLLKGENAVSYRGSTRIVSAPGLASGVIIEIRSSQPNQREQLFDVLNRTVGDVNALISKRR